MARKIRRGDVYLLSLDPIEGREQAGKRYVVVISPDIFNTATGVPLVCPITQGVNYARNAGYAVSLSGAGTNAQGVVLCHQLRSMDFAARHAKFIESLPTHIMDEVLARVQTLVE